MERIYPNPKTFVDFSEPDLDAQYFNGLEKGVSAIDERLAAVLLNSLTATEAGKKALDAVVGKILNDKIAANAASIASLNSNLNRTKEMEIPGGNSAQIYFTCSGSKRAVFVVSGAYGADHTLHDVIPVNIPAITTTSLTTITNIKHLGSYITMTIYAAKVSDGKYRIKLAGLTSSFHGVVTGNCEIDRIVYAAD